MPLSREQILRAVGAALTPAELSRGRFYLDRRLRAPGENVALGPRPIGPAAPAYFVFGDLLPEANWGHPAAYFFIDAATGATVRIDTSFPPFDGDPPADFLPVVPPPGPAS